MSWFNFFFGESREIENEKKCIAQGYPTTRTPSIHANLKHSVNFKTFKLKSGEEMLGLTYAHEGVDLVQKASLEIIRNRMLTWFGKYPELAEHFKATLPTNLLAISFAMVNFEVGDSCQDFKLLAKFKQPDGAFFSYQKQSESVQYCIYNEDGLEYLAGVTYYPTQHGRAPLLENNKALLSLMLPIPYPPQDRRESYYYKNNKTYSRFCKTAGKIVRIIMDANDDIPRHYDFNHDTKTSFETLCKECLEDHFTYKWEEPMKTSDVASSTEKRTTSEENISKVFEKIDLEESGGKYDNELDAELIN